GIRDRNVTGVQTCALPISIDEQKCIAPDLRQAMSQVPGCAAEIWQSRCRTGREVIGRPHRKSKQAPLPLGAENAPLPLGAEKTRSEERRVGKEGRREGRR